MMLTTAQAAAELGLHVSRIRVLLAAGRIQGASKHGRDWAIPSPVIVLPPGARPKHCPYLSCAHLVYLPGGRPRCGIGLMGVSGQACPRYEPRPGLAERQRPGWAR